MEIIKFFGGACLLLGFIYFILIRAISTNNYIRKSFYIFISGLVITLFFIGGIIYDVYTGDFLKLKDDINYYAFPMLSTIFMIGVSLFYYIKGNKRRQRFKHNFKKEKVVPTIKDKKEFVYVIMKYENSFYLQKYIEKETQFYKGLVLKFSNNDFFHDKIIRQYIDKTNLDIISYKYIGKGIKKEKKDNVYYCYKILLNSIPNNPNNFELVDPYTLLKTNIKEEDKKIIYSSIINEDFDIDL